MLVHAFLLLALLMILQMNLGGERANTIKKKRKTTMPSCLKIASV
jgi:hypothetical protein